MSRWVLSDALDQLEQLVERKVQLEFPGAQIAPAPSSKQGISYLKEQKLNKERREALSSDDVACGIQLSQQWLQKVGAYIDTHSMYVCIASMLALYSYMPYSRI